MNKYIGAKLAAVVIVDPAFDIPEGFLRERAQGQVDREAKDVGVEATEVEFVGDFPADEHAATKHLAVASELRVHEYLAYGK